MAIITKNEMRQNKYFARSEIRFTCIYYPALCRQVHTVVRKIVATDKNTDRHMRKSG